MLFEEHREPATSVHLFLTQNPWYFGRSPGRSWYISLFVVCSGNKNKDLLSFLLKLSKNMDTWKHAVSCVHTLLSRNADDGFWVLKTKQFLKSICIVVTIIITDDFWCQPAVFPLNVFISSLNKIRFFFPLSEKTPNFSYLEAQTGSTWRFAFDFRKLVLPFPFCLVICFLQFPSVLGVWS